MINSKFKILLLLSATPFMLIACGGGGGGGSAVVAPTPTPTPPGGAANKLNRTIGGTVMGTQIAEGSYTQGISGSLITTQGPDLDTNTNKPKLKTVSYSTNYAASDVTLTFSADGNSATAKVAGNANTNLTDNTTKFITNYGSTTFRSSDDKGQIDLFQKLGATSVTQSYVGTIRDTSTMGQVDATTGATRDVSDLTLIYGGVPATNLPTTGTATYKGEALGKAGVVGSSMDNYLGKASMTADFSAAKVNGTLNDFVNQNRTGATAANSPTISFTGDISGTQFSGATTLTGQGQNAGVTGSGRTQGGFYGAGGAEAVGAFGTSVQTPNGNGVFMGVMGMKKQ